MGSARAVAPDEPGRDMSRAPRSGAGQAPLVGVLCQKLPQREIPTTRVKQLVLLAALVAAVAVLAVLVL